jgi:hypothetical protein
VCECTRLARIPGNKPTKTEEIIECFAGHPSSLIPGNKPTKTEEKKEQASEDTINRQRANE